MTDPDGTVARIDAAVEAWESGPDAFRWDGDAEPDEARGAAQPVIDPALWDAAVDRMWQEEIRENPRVWHSGDAPALTQRTVLDEIRRIQESQPRVICAPEVAEQIRHRGLSAVIVESEYVPPGTAYVFRPDIFSARTQEDA